MRTLLTEPSTGRTLAFRRRTITARVAHSLEGRLREIAH
jgi:hypothetical protein